MERETLNYRVMNWKLLENFIINEAGEVVGMVNETNSAGAFIPEAKKHAQVMSAAPELLRAAQMAETMLLQLNAPAESAGVRALKTAIEKALN